MEGDLLEVAATHEGLVELERVNAAEAPLRARELRVLATPTLIGFRDGAEVFRSTGRASASDLDAMFTALGTGEVLTPPVSPSGLVLAGLAAAVLIGFGIVAGPSIPLLAIGAVVLSTAAVPHVRRWRADRS